MKLVLHGAVMVVFAFLTAPWLGKGFKAWIEYIDWVMKI